MPEISTSTIPSNSNFWRLPSNFFYSAQTPETYPEYFYPTYRDRNDAGVFFLDLVHNVQTADMNGDGFQDIVINQTLFPHVIPHRLLKPLLFFNDKNLSFRTTDWLETAVDAAHHMSYRFGLPDLNNDGTPDYVSSSMGLAQRNSDGTFTNVWEPVPVHVSNSQGWLDQTRNVEGQENLGASTFGHDFSFGDVNNDGWIDFYTGGHLYINENGSRFSNGDTILSSYTSKQTMWDASGGYYPMSSLIVDINNDGFDDLLIWYADDFPDVAGYLALSGPTSVGERGNIPLPDGRYGDQNTRFNFAIADDLNHDGFKDVIVGETRVSPYYHGRQLQLLMNHTGVLVDESNLRLPSDPRAYLTEPSFGSVGNGEGQIFLVDVNDDGHLDIVDTGGINHSSRQDQLLILLNDGAANFIQMPLSELPYFQPWHLAGFEWTKEWQLKGHSKMIPIDLDGRSGIDWIGAVTTPLTSWPQTVPSEISLYTVTSISRFGKAGGGLEGWQVGVPGFDETYYVNRHPDVAASITRGEIISGLNHYLDVGRDQGRYTFAPFTKVWGGAAQDRIVLREGDECARGEGGDDFIFGAEGNDQIDGGDGNDTSSYTGATSEYSTVYNSSSFTIGGRRSISGTDILTNIEYIQFSDAAIETTWFSKTNALTASQSESLVELYIASFNRAPDAIGLNYWGGRLYDGMTLPEIAKSFFVQPETVAAYPSSMATRTFVTTVYNNVLSRSPDTDGLNYWVREIDTGNISKDVFLLAIINGAKASTGSAIDRETLANKVTVGNYFAFDKGINNTTWGIDVMDSVTSVASTVTAANALTDSYSAAIATGTSSSSAMLVGLPDLNAADPATGLI